MTQLDAVQQFTSFVVDASYASLPDDAEHAAQEFLLDTIAVGIAGSASDGAHRVLAAAHEWGEADAATVLGSGERLPVTSAAFVNSFQIHCQEFDCLHEGATVHAMAVLTGALLALAERRRWSGSDLLLGVALGVDVAANLGLAASSGLRFFRPATAGALGATAALARLEGFDDAEFRDAWGLAYSQLAGTMQAHVEGSIALPLQVAVAARAAITSVQLVREGLSGPHDILEGPYGYFELFEEGGDLESVLNELGRVWRITELSHKPFPTGRAAHGTLDAITELRRERAFTMEDVKAINAYVPPLVERLVARPLTPGMSVNYARLCLQYLVPVLMRDGAVDTTSFGRATLDDLDILRQGIRVHVINDGNPDPNALGPQRVEVVLNDGTRLERAVPHTLGSPENPLSHEQRRDKFFRCLAAGGLSRDRAEALLALLEDLAEVRDAAEILRLAVR